MRERLIVVAASVLAAGWALACSRPNPAYQAGGVDGGGIGGSTGTGGGGGSGGGDGGGGTGGTCTDGAVRSCFTGPGNQNVGVCRGGSQTCISGNWSTCTGQVVASG